MHTSITESSFGFYTEHCVWRRCGTIRPAVVSWKPPVVTLMTVRVQPSVDRWDMRLLMSPSKRPQEEEDQELSVYTENGPSAIVCAKCFCDATDLLWESPHNHLYKVVQRFQESRLTGYTAAKNLETFQQRNKFIELYCLDVCHSGSWCLTHIHLSFDRGESKAPASREEISWRATGHAAPLQRSAVLYF